MSDEDRRADDPGDIPAGLRDLARAHRILDLEGHNDMSLGHLSWRDPEGRGLWLKRGNIGLEEVQDSDFILLSFDGEVLEGDGLRHLEWPIHSEILRARPEVNVVAHTHPFHATALSATTAEIRPYTNEGVWFTESVPHFKLTSDLVNTPLLGRELAVALGPSAAAVLLKNHGADVRRHRHPGGHAGRGVPGAGGPGPAHPGRLRAGAHLPRRRRDPPEAADHLSRPGRRELLAVLQPQARPGGRQRDMTEGDR